MTVLNKERSKEVFKMQEKIRKSLFSIFVAITMISLYFILPLLLGPLFAENFITVTFVFSLLTPVTIFILGLYNSIIWYKK